MKSVIVSIGAGAGAAGAAVAAPIFWPNMTYGEAYSQIISLTDTKLQTIYDI